jgi:hypothetical protein
MSGNGGRHPTAMELKRARRNAKRSSSVANELAEPARLLKVLKSTDEADHNWLSNYRWSAPTEAGASSSASVRAEQSAIGVRVFACVPSVPAQMITSLPPFPPPLPPKRAMRHADLPIDWSLKTELCLETREPLGGLGPSPMR